MPPTVGSRVNRLIDRIEGGDIDILAFVRSLGTIPETSAGIGPFVRPSTTRPASRPKGKLVRTGVVLALKKVTSKGNVVELNVMPNAVDFAQSFRDGVWKQEVKAGKAEVQVGSDVHTLDAGAAIDIPAGKKFRFANRGTKRWQSIVQQPPWKPDQFTYEFGGRKMAGADLWFEIKTSVNDRKDRPFYNVRDMNGGTYVVIMVEQDTRTIRSYYSETDNVITMLSGSGELIITRADKKHTVPLMRGTSAMIDKGEVFEIVNTAKFPLFVEVRPTTPRAWTPESSFWEISANNFVTGDQVYFQFVVPSV